MQRDNFGDFTNRLFARLAAIVVSHNNNPHVPHVTLVGDACVDRSSGAPVLYLESIGGRRMLDLPTRTEPLGRPRMTLAANGGGA